MHALRVQIPLQLLKAHLTLHGKCNRDLVKLAVQVGNPTGWVTLVPIIQTFPQTSSAGNRDCLGN